MEATGRSCVCRFRHIILHAELRLGSGIIMLGSLNDKMPDRHVKLPAELGGRMLSVVRPAYFGSGLSQRRRDALVVR